MPPFLCTKVNICTSHRQKTEGGAKGASYGVRKSAGVQDIVFEDWFWRHYLNGLKNLENPVCFILMAIEVT